jgi:hypothetical protein
MLQKSFTGVYYLMAAYFQLPAPRYFYLYGRGRVTSFPSAQPQRPSHRPKLIRIHVIAPGDADRVPAKAHKIDLGSLRYDVRPIATALLFIRCSHYKIRPTLGQLHN